jgi:hypothetical protein
MYRKRSKIILNIRKLGSKNLPSTTRLIILGIIYVMYVGLSAKVRRAIPEQFFL